MPFCQLHFTINDIFRRGPPARTKPSSKQLPIHSVWREDRHTSVHVRLAQSPPHNNCDAASSKEITVTRASSHISRQSILKIKPDPATSSNWIDPMFRASTSQNEKRIHAIPAIGPTNGRPTLFRVRLSPKPSLTPPSLPNCWSPPRFSPA